MRRLRLERRVVFSAGLVALLVLASFVSSVPLAQAISSDLVIDQVYGGGGASAATRFCNDAVEIHNNGSATVNLGGKSIQYGASTGNFGGSSAQVFALPALDLAPGAYFLLQAGSASTGACTPLPSPDAAASGMNISATSGKVALVDQVAAL